MTKKQDLPHISKRIVALREARGLSQKDLGTLAGVTAPAITMWETGKRFPRGKNLKNLAKALGVSEAAILDDAVPMPAVEKQASTPDNRAQSILDIQSKLNGLTEGELKDVRGFIEDLELRRNVARTSSSDAV